MIIYLYVNELNNSTYQIKLECLPWLITWPQLYFLFYLPFILLLPCNFHTPWTLYQSPLDYDPLHSDNSLCLFRLFHWPRLFSLLSESMAMSRPFPGQPDAVSSSWSTQVPSHSELTSPSLFCVLLIPDSCHLQSLPQLLWITVISLCLFPTLHWLKIWSM